MEEASLVHMFHLENHITVPATARRGHDILVKRKRDEDNDGQEVHRRAHGAHALRDLALVRLAHVPAHEAGAHERGAQPADHGVAQREGKKGQSEGGDEGLAIALECVCEDGEGGGGEGEEGEALGAGEGGGGGGGRHGRERERELVRREVKGKGEKKERL